MTKIAWLTDIHVNFLELDARKQFYQSVSETHADSILITGYIGEAKDVCDLLIDIGRSQQVRSGPNGTNLRNSMFMQPPDDNEIVA